MDGSTPRRKGAVGGAEVPVPSAGRRMDDGDSAYWFSAHETATLAAEVEEKGAAFYQRLSVEVSDVTVSNMCLFFAGQEEEHRKAFRSIADHFHGKVDEFAYTVDIRAMLRASMADLVALFADHPNRLTNGRGVVDCLNLARRIEATAVGVYTDMRRAYAERFSDVLLRIVEEEQAHLKMVESVLARV
jgi:rubrerythrin